MVARYTLQKTTLPTTLPVPSVGFMYLIIDENNQIRGVINVAGVATIVEVVDSALIGADPAGTAAAAIVTHVGESDPHTQYQTAPDVAGGIAAHAAMGSAHHVRYDDSEAVSAMGSKANSNALHHDKYTDAEALIQGQSAVSSHVALADPHTQYQLLTGKGVANGYAGLDGTGKVPLSQLPTLDGLSFEGLWDADTNSPALASGVGTEGSFYIVNVAGNTNLDGISDWEVKDWAIFFGGVWLKLDNSDSVVSVNTQTGVVVLDATDVGADPSGTAAAAIAAHVADLTPHPGIEIEETVNEEKVRIVYELEVGTPSDPKESVFGEGDSYTEGMIVKNSVSLIAGPFTDVTAEASSRGGSTFNMFSALTTNATLLIGGPTKFPGIKYVLDTLGVGLDSDDLEFGYWNGASFVPFNIMSTRGSWPYTQLAQDYLESVTDFQCRWFFDDTLWQLSTIDGDNLYWIQVRYTGGGMVTSPTGELIKLHTNRTEINKDGFVERFGRAIPRGTIPQISLKQTDDLAGFSPSNETLNFSTDIGLTPVDNEFQNSTIDAIGGTFPIEEGLDTSRPISVEVLYTPLNNGSGDVEFELIICPTRVGDELDGSLPQSIITAIETLPGGEDNIIRRVDIEFTVEDLVPGETVAWSLLRQADGGNADDTYGGNIAIVSIVATGSYWRDTK